MLFYNHLCSVIYLYFGDFEMKTKNIATTFAILAAALYAINIPLSKLLLTQVQPTMMAACLYFGAGFGLLLCTLLSPQTAKTEPLTKKEFPYIIGMIVLDIAAPIFADAGAGTHQFRQCVPAE